MFDSRYLEPSLKDPTDVIINPIDWAIEEIIDDLLLHGSILIGREETHVMELYEYGDPEDQANLILMTVRDPANAKVFAETIIRDCATHYFNEIASSLVLEYIEEKNSPFQETAMNYEQVKNAFLAKSFDLEEATQDQIDQLSDELDDPAVQEDYDYHKSETALMMADAQCESAAAASYESSFYS